jgi:hypothetical protein
MSHNIASDTKWIYEVRGGVFLGLGERIELADGWWFSTHTGQFGPFETEQQALDAAGDASDASAELNILASPDDPLPVTDAGEIYPLYSMRGDQDDVA